MEVTYTLEKSDYLQFNRFVINRVPALKRQAFLRFFFLPALIAFELYVAHTPRLAFLVVLCAVTAAWIAYLSWAQRRAVVTQAQARVGAIGLHTVSLRPDGLYLANIADRPPLTLARREVATAAAAFAHVALVSEAAAFRGRRYANLVLAASARPLPVEVWNREIRGGAVPMRLLAGRELPMFSAGAKPIEPHPAPSTATPPAPSA